MNIDKKAHSVKRERSALFCGLTNQSIDDSIFQHKGIMEQKKILIADDNENIREALTYLLEDEGYNLSLAKDGAETLRKVREVHPDILFLDIMMPEINGYDVCRAIKTDPALKGIYVIMLTAKGQVAEQERGKQVGADEYIVKPFSPMEIITKIKTLFNR